MPLFDASAPFVLLDDASPDGSGGTHLYADATAIISVPADGTPGDIRSAFDQVRMAARDGLHAAGFIGFEAGYALEPRLHALARAPRDGLPLLWFGLFAAPRLLSATELSDILAGDARISGWSPGITEADHAAAMDRVAALIAAGDIYQANLTFPARVLTEGDPLALYGRLRAAQNAPYGAVIHTGDAWALSFSPELFFDLQDSRLTARPMKGTASRHASSKSDSDAANALAADPKNRAENLMIVDLLRNDLSRVAIAGSVAVPKLFEIETYPTIHQMTSTVTATLLPDRDPVDVLTALFPCGSVSGAPKIRAMEAIAAIEPEPRGLYTGSIGAISPGGDATFNVAIRTLVIDGEGRTTIGLGSGIVADSRAAEEWQECLAKGRFLAHAAPQFDLIETMRFDPQHGIARLSLHLARMAASASLFGWPWDGHHVRTLLGIATMAEREPRRVRLVLSASGAAAVHLSPLPPPPVGPAKVRIVPLPVDPADWRLAHKTSERGFYDTARRESGADEVLFVRPDGLLTEGSFTSLFVERYGLLLTPPLGLGLLPGILRAELLASGAAVEHPLRAADLAGGFLIGNSLRGLRPARLA